MCTRTCTAAVSCVLACSRRHRLPAVRYCRKNCAPRLSAEAADVRRSIVGFTSTMRELERSVSIRRICVGRSAVRMTGAATVGGRVLCRYGSFCIPIRCAATQGDVRQVPARPPADGALEEVDPHHGTAHGYLLHCCTYVCLYVVALRSHCRVAAHWYVVTYGLGGAH